MNAGKPGSGSFMKEKGIKILKFGRYVGGILTVATVGFGTYDDYVNTDKTLGEAGTKNIGNGIATGVFTGGISGVVLVAATTAGSATPIGWAFIAGLGTATVTTTIFNYAYDNNILFLQDGLDWTGQRIDDAGEALSGFFNSINRFINN